MRGYRIFPNDMAPIVGLYNHLLQHPEIQDGKPKAWFCDEHGMPDFSRPINLEKPMIPQSVTERYVTNLIQNGINAEFRLDSLCCFPWVAEERICGYYYKAGIFPNGADLVSDVGPTPQAAVKNALAKAGVTFR